jgi:hypothetical protein
MGFYHFDQIAAWTPAEVAWVDARLKFKGRIERDNWIAQADGVRGRGLTPDRSTHLTQMSHPLRVDLCVLPTRSVGAGKHLGEHQMAENMTGRRFVAITAAWTVAAILGLTVALLAVGFLGLWVAVGAIAGLGTTVVCGIFGQFLFATDFDAVLAEAPLRAQTATKRLKGARQTEIPRYNMGAPCHAGGAIHEFAVRSHQSSDRLGRRLGDRVSCDGRADDRRGLDATSGPFRGRDHLLSCFGALLSFLFLKPVGGPVEAGKMAHADPAPTVPSMTPLRSSKPAGWQQGRPRRRSCSETGARAEASARARNPSLPRSPPIPGEGTRPAALERAARWRGGRPQADQGDRTEAGEAVQQSRLLPFRPDRQLDRRRGGVGRPEPRRVQGPRDPRHWVEQARLWPRAGRRNFPRKSTKVMYTRLREGW